jgi:hypothetical protein
MSHAAEVWTTLTLLALTLLAWHDTVVLRAASAERQADAGEGDD